MFNIIKLFKEIHSIKTFQLSKRSWSGQRKPNCKCTYACIKIWYLKLIIHNIILKLEIPTYFRIITLTKKSTNQTVFLHVSRESQV